MEEANASFELNRQRGDVLMRLRRYEEAVQCYQAALTGSPFFDCILYCNISLCLSDLDPERAEHAAREAVHLNPEFSRAWYVLAISLNAQHLSIQALDAVDRSLTLNSASGESIAFKIHLLCDMRDYSAAFVELNRGLELLPEEIEIRQAGLRAYILSERTVLAQNLLEGTLRLAPDQSNVFYYAGCYYALTGNYSKARSMYKDALRLNPMNTNAESNLREFWWREPLYPGELLIIGGNVLAYFLVAAELAFPSNGKPGAISAETLFMGVPAAWFATYALIRFIRYVGVSPWAPIPR